MNKDDFITRCSEMWDLLHVQPGIRQDLIDYMQTVSKTKHTAFIRTAWAISRSLGDDTELIGELKRLGGDKDESDEIQRRIVADIPVSQRGSKIEPKENEAKQALIKQRRVEVQKAVYEGKIRVAELKRTRLKAEADADYYASLAANGVKHAIIAAAIRNGDLQEAKETRIQAQVNHLRRSNGGVIRLESGDGK